LLTTVAQVASATPTNTERPSAVRTVTGFNIASTFKPDTGQMIFTAR